MKSKSKMSGALAAELESLLSALTFSHEGAGCRVGHHWIVYAHPWPGKEKSRFDVMIHLRPRGTNAESGQGLRVAVRRGNVFWLTTDTTNRRGQVWCKNLPHGEYHGCLCDRTVEREAALSAAVQTRRSSAGTQIDAPLELRLPDRRIVSVIAKGPAGRAFFAASSDSPKMAGATLQADFGIETVTLTLQACKDARIWEDSCLLEETFDRARFYVPDILVKPKRTR